MSAPGQKDPVAVAVFATAIVVLVGLVAYVALFVRPPPPPPSPPPVAKPAPKPASTLPVAQSQSTYRFFPGHMWVYAVTVEPPIWRDITLTYRTERRGSDVGAQTEFKHAGGQMNFYLGTLVPGHATHANVRFPGFFLHPVYFPPDLKAGQRFTWEWPWQPVQPGRVKRYEAEVQGWEDVKVPAGTFPAARIVAALRYIEGGTTRASSRETLWYAPKAGQIVRVIREGRAPDEGSERIVAELAQFR